MLSPTSGAFSHSHALGSLDGGAGHQGNIQQHVDKQGREREARGQLGTERRNDSLPIWLGTCQLQEPAGLHGPMISYVGGQQ